MNFECIRMHSALGASTDLEELMRIDTSPTESASLPSPGLPGEGRG